MNNILIVNIEKKNIRWLQEIFQDVKIIWVKLEQEFQSELSVHQFDAKQWG